MMSVRLAPPTPRTAAPPAPAPANGPICEPHDFDDAMREGGKVLAPEKDDIPKDDVPQNVPDGTPIPAVPVALDALLAQVSPPVVPAAPRGGRSAAKEDEPAPAPGDALPSGAGVETDVPLPAIVQQKVRPGGAGGNLFEADAKDKPSASALVPHDSAGAHAAQGHRGEEGDSTLEPPRAVAVKSVAAGQHFPVVGDPVRQIASDVKQAIETTAATAAPDPAPSSVKTLNVQLEPESLGTVTLRMRLSGNQLSIRVDVAEPATLDMIQRDRDRLQKSMTTESVSVDQLEIRSARETAPVTSGDNANATRQDASPQGQASRQNDGAAGNGAQQRRETRGTSHTGQDSTYGHENNPARGADAGGVYL